MFPDFHYLFRALFGIDIPALGILKTFGFFVAMGFLVAAYILTRELKRKEEAGELSPLIEVQKENAPPTIYNLITRLILGFLLGFKLIGFFIGNALSLSFGDYILSGKGHGFAGLIVAILAYFWWKSDVKKAADKQVIETQVKVYPHQRVADIIFIAAITGLVGAKIFNALETWEHFIQDPIGNLFSASGLTYYGGLIFATIALYIYSRKKQFSFKRLCDACAPALIIAYGVGRLGCQFAGDGDWGIYNSAYVTNEQGQVVAASGPDEFNQIVQDNPNAFYEFRNFKEVPHKYFPSILPTWMVAQNYKYNVNNDGIPIVNPLPGDYNHVLPAAVFPTPIYEFFMSLLIFSILWLLRRRFKTPLQLFGVYLIFNGLERFLIEQIRVNTKYDFGFIQPTQAELISTGLIIAGITLFLYVTKKSKINLEISSDE